MTNRLTKTNVRELLDQHNVFPSRALGQNFLCDGGTVDKIVRLAGVKKSDCVIEIGPGIGSLTLGLLDAGANIEAIEIDRHLIPLLQDVLQSHPQQNHVRVHNKDIREISWPEILGDHSWSVIANLPYNIATPLILDLLAARPEFTRWLVCLLYTSPSPRDKRQSRMPSSA